MEDLGCILDLTAGTLSSKRTGFVAVLIPSLDDPDFSDTARGIERRLEGGGLRMLLGATDDDLRKEVQLAEATLRRRPETLVVTGGRHTERARRRLKTAGIPVIETWDLPEAPVEHVVGFSDAAAAGAVVQHLYGDGCRAVAHIGGSTDRDTRGMDRRRGYERAVRDLGLPPGPTVACGAPPIAMRQGSEAVVDLLGRHRRSMRCRACRISRPSAPSPNASAGAGRSGPPRGRGVRRLRAVALLPSASHHRLGRRLRGSGRPRGRCCSGPSRPGATGPVLPPETVRTPFVVMARETS